LSSKLETEVITFGKVRRWLVAAFGLFVAVKGLVRHDWLSLGLGAAIIAYGMLVPT
jgi:type IV secretory pathway TrbD component